MMMVKRVGQTRPLHLDSEAHARDVQQLEVVVLTRLSHEHVQGPVHLDDPLLPVQLEVGEAEVHLLRGVVGIEAGVKQELGRLGG